MKKTELKLIKVQQDKRASLPIVTQAVEAESLAIQNMQPDPSKSDSSSPPESVCAVIL